MQVFRGGGNVIWGQKTLQAKSSALDRVNVRRLLITMEKAMSISLRGYCFETNTDLTRFRVSGMLTEYCDKLSSRGAFQTELGDNGYLVVCDEDNNQPAIIDDNQMNVDVFVKPVRSAEAIQLTVIATRTGASFEELMARGVLM
jgi:phage tail sheath protein FI